MSFVMGWSLYCFAAALSALLFGFLVKNRGRTFKSTTKLPPGTMGWPFLGETLQLYSHDPNIFFAAKQKRYGEIFKTHLLGCPCIMLASPEAARFVLMNQAHLFKPTYPKSKELMIGPNAIFFHQGDYHARLRKLVQGALSPEVIRSIVPDIEAIALPLLDSWDGRVINTFLEMKKYTFDVGILSIFGSLDLHYKEELKKNYCVVDQGYNSFPNKIPGTLYRNAVQARKELSKILGTIISERREKAMEKKKLLGSLLLSRDGNGEPLSDEQISDNIIGVLFAAQDTTASVLTWVLKYLVDNPKLLEAVRAEHVAIQEANENARNSVTWAQTRNAMPLTSKVISETLRMASILSFTFREAIADVEYKGYLIPKGWKVMPLFRNIHHNPDFFPDPHRFDPSRFQVPPKLNTFLPFGTGAHACPGNELAKLEMLILLHHLVTNFGWEVVGPRHGIQYCPFPIPKDGLLARFHKDPAIQDHKNSNQ
ncbi:hypothetical protein AMTRI_Chr04g184590 [Amborella trichopoda]|uniref:(+)-abscisic acid 8'-hydroxylase n=1 Tax=Amborella trichopoda TaxID=13333 RepID=W1NTB6_AMBTC|nr:abscisic acid 8'-hydroxylase 3 [Amborella trichopoda]ERN00632.1 hypothetical protein AMTR_s00091p00146660 [Amborella trichopoda]|eukprot:XP_006838063.1 abscisic acid 8'-hydroxylase 3 [Amborella trichopoda]